MEDVGAGTRWNPGSWTFCPWMQMPRQRREGYVVCSWCQPERSLPSICMVPCPSNHCAGGASHFLRLLCGTNNGSVLDRGLRIAGGNGLHLANFLSLLTASRLLLFRQQPSSVFTRLLKRATMTCLTTTMLTPAMWLWPIQVFSSTDTKLKSIDGPAVHSSQSCVVISAESGERSHGKINA